MSAQSIAKRSANVPRPSRGRADLDHLRHMSEADIQRTAPPELAELPEDFWDEAVVVVPKQAISLRVDEDVLAWFKRHGPKYQTRMNAVLRAYMRRQAGGAARSPAVQHWAVANQVMGGRKKARKRRR